jgi:hypothetical protein
MSDIIEEKDILITNCAIIMNGNSKFYITIKNADVSGRIVNNTFYCPSWLIRKAINALLWLDSLKKTTSFLPNYIPDNRESSFD